MSDDGRTERNRERFAHQCRQAVRRGQLAVLGRKTPPVGLTLDDVRAFEADWFEIEIMKQDGKR